MAIKDWYKLTFQIESDLEDIIIWKLNEIGIFSFSFEYLKKTENISLIASNQSIEKEINNKISMF